MYCIMFYMIDLIVYITHIQKSIIIWLKVFTYAVGHQRELPHQYVGIELKVTYLYL